ncbi:MAG: hypothetical protein ISR45_11670 [Rhodospirillales bacterium]|nr:hypothetical protein [Rhodospirillales bacterium]
MKEVTFRDLPTGNYLKFREACYALEQPFTFVLSDEDVTDTENTALKHIKQSMLPAILANKVIYNDIILKDEK